MTALFTLPALVCLTVYTLTVGGLLWVNYRLHRKPKPVPEVVNWLPYLPPVPPSDCRWCAAFDADADATWLDAWPTDLTDELVDRLFDDIVAIEGLS